MATKFLNRVRMSVSGAPGTGIITVGTQATGFQTFTNAGMNEGDQTPYLLEDGSPLGSAWEIGLGTWHTNGTFARTSITQSSAGGTTPITASSNAVLTAIFRASDLAGAQALSALTDTSIVSPADGQLLVYSASAGKWVNQTVASGASSPAVVQYKTVQISGAGAVNVTLNTAPTPGNLLIAMGQGGGATALGAYSTGFSFALADRKNSWSQPNQYVPGYGFKAVRATDTAGPYQIGNIGSGGPEFAGVMFEVSGVDITRVSEFQMAYGLVGTASTTFDVLSKPNSLFLSFAGGDPNTISVTSPTPQYTNNNGSSTLVVDYDNTTGNWNGLIASIASGTAGALCMSLAGV